ncbi:MAG: PaaI family thioesterase [Acidimicrobiales bacterium]
MLAPNADRFAPLSPGRADRWAAFPNWPGQVLFPKLVGLELEEVRTDYARMRLPWRPELAQPAGVLHGGAVATLIDTVVVPAVGSAYEQTPRMLTLSLNISYLAAIVAGEDAVAEGWVERRGRSIVFLRAEVLAASSGERAASGSLVYKVTPQP